LAAKGGSTELAARKAPGIPHFYSESEAAESSDLNGGTGRSIRCLLKAVQSKEGGKAEGDREAEGDKGMNE
jgi:hypothetical protein